MIVVQQSKNYITDSSKLIQLSELYYKIQFQELIFILYK